MANRCRHNKVWKSIQNRESYHVCTSHHELLILCGLSGTVKCRLAASSCNKTRQRKWKSAEY